MDVNKKAIMICTIFIVIIGTYITLISKTDAIPDILLGIFTGLTVSIITSLVYYFHEKTVIISKIKAQVLVVYVDLLVVKQITGSILPRIIYTPMLDTLNYRTIISIADIIVRAIDKSSLKLYSPFFKYGKWHNLVESVDAFEDKLYNLKVCLNNIQLNVLNADLLQLEKYSSSFGFSQEKESLLIATRNTINVQTAKVHEYEASLLRELDDLGIEIYGESWEKRKDSLTSQATNILQNSMI